MGKTTENDLEQLSLWNGKDGHDNIALYTGESLISGRKYEWRFVSLAIAHGMMKEFGATERTMAEISKALDAEAWDYSRRWRNEFSPILDMFLLRDSGATKILEIGSGVGLNAYVLTRYGRVAAMEMDKERLQWAIESWKGLGVNDRIAHYNENIMTSKLPDKSFDVILTVTMFQHLSLKDKLSTIDAIKRLVRPGGVVMMREGRIFDEPIEVLDEKYRHADWAAHMVPISLELLADRFSPFRVEKISNMNFLIHHPEGVS